MNNFNVLLDKKQNTEYNEHELIKLPSEYYPTVLVGDVIEQLKNFSERCGISYSSPTPSTTRMSLGFGFKWYWFVIYLNNFKSLLGIPSP